MTGYRAVCWQWHPDVRNFVLHVFRDDDHDEWSDAPLDAATPEDMPAAAERRLAGTGWRIVGPWTRDEGVYGPEWSAPAEYRSTQATPETGHDRSASS